MLNCRKVFISVMAAATLGFTACNSNLSDAVFENNVEAPSSTTYSTAKSNQYSQIKLTSSLNPGYGYAVYFTGSFNESNYTTAVRGNWENGAWVLRAHCELGTACGWNTYVGSYDLGETLTDFSNLTLTTDYNAKGEWYDAKTYRIYVPCTTTVGRQVYFTGTFQEGNNWTKANKAAYSYVIKAWYLDVVAEDANFEWKALRLNENDYNYDNEITDFSRLTWFEGANNVGGKLTSEAFTTDAKQRTFLSTYNYETGYLKFSELNSCIDDAYWYNEIEILNAEGKVVYGLYKNFKSSVKDAFYIDGHDETIYTIRVTPCSNYYTKGIPCEKKFCAAEMNFTASYLSVKKFNMGRYEVTQKQFKEVLGGNASAIGDYALIGDNYPVYNVSFPMAIAYCNKKSIMCGLTPVYHVQGVDFSTITYEDLRNIKDFTVWKNVTQNAEANGYRLPNIQEWTVAANVDSTTYSGSDTASEVAYVRGPYGIVAEVGSLKPNSAWMYDMSGNVAEWCFDTHGENERHVRGGGFDSAAEDFEIWTVNYAEAYNCCGNYSQGFRLCRTITD